MWNYTALHERDLIEIDGFVQHFVYEEFHPNHDYDLRGYAEEFIDLLLRKKLNELIRSVSATRFVSKVYPTTSQESSPSLKPFRRLMILLKSINLKFNR